MSTAVATPPGGEMDPPGAWFQPARLGLFDATMLVAGSMIGSGIFIVCADIRPRRRLSGWLLPSGCSPASSRSSARSVMPNWRP